MEVRSCPFFFIGDVVDGHGSAATTPVGLGFAHARPRVFTGVNCSVTLSSEQIFSLANGFT